MNNIQNPSHIFRTLFVVVFVLLSAVYGWAQTPGEVELVGEVVGMTLDTITVNGQEINIVGAELDVPLALLILVEVEGTLNPDGSITARQVSAAQEDVIAGEAELIGTLDSFDGATMTVNGQVVDVTNAEIKTGITFGGSVKIHAMATGANTWLAREAEPHVPDVHDNNNAEIEQQPTPAGEFEIIGSVEEVGAESIMVAGQTISIVGAEIKDSFVAGISVKVHVRLVDGVLVAREIENFVGDDNNNDDIGNRNTNVDNNNPASNNNLANLNTNGNANTDFANSNTDESNTNTANQNTNNLNSTNTNTTNNDNTVSGTQISEQQAIARVQEIYPNALIVSSELETKFGGVLVWEIKTSHGVEVNINVDNGVILTIEADDGGNGNVNNNVNNGNGTNANNNTNVGNNNGTANNNANNNTDFGNVNNNGNANDNDDDRNDNDDNSGRGSGDDDDDDDNSGRGSGDDDDDDNSGRGSGDDDDDDDD